MKLITFQEVKDIPREKWSRVRHKGENKLVFEDENDEEYLLENVTVEEVGSYYAVTDGDERIFVRQYLKRNPRASLLMLVLFPLLLLLATRGADFIKTKYIRNPGTDQEIQTKINDLKSIQNSIKNLSGYVNSQKQTLEDTSNILESLKKEKSSLEAALKIDKQQLDSLLFTMRKDANKEKWIERVISFVTGVISSLIATRIWYLRRS